MSFWYGAVLINDRITNRSLRLTMKSISLFQMLSKKKLMFYKKKFDTFSRAFKKARVLSYLSADAGFELISPPTADAGGANKAQL